MRVPVALPSGGWTWGELPRHKGGMVREYAYNAHECRALVMAYGRILGLCLKTSEAERFVISAKGPVSQYEVGRQQWEYCSATRSYEPVGEYLCQWKQAARVYFERTGELISRQKFSASTRPPVLSAVVGPRSPLTDQGPHVKAKEDVPHEDALPDLYGLRSA
jgi:hypothetical protein